MWSPPSPSAPEGNYFSVPAAMEGNADSSARPAGSNVASDAPIFQLRLGPVPASYMHPDLRPTNPSTPGAPVPSAAALAVPGFPGLPGVPSSGATVCSVAVAVPPVAGQAQASQHENSQSGDGGFGSSSGLYDSANQDAVSSFGHNDNYQAARWPDAGVDDLSYMQYQDGSVPVVGDQTYYPGLTAPNAPAHGHDVPPASGYTQHQYQDALPQEYYDPEYRPAPAPNFPAHGHNSEMPGPDGYNPQPLAHGPQAAQPSFNPSHQYNEYGRGYAGLAGQSSGFNHNPYGNDWGTGGDFYTNNYPLPQQPASRLGVSSGPHGPSGFGDQEEDNEPRLDGSRPAPWIGTIVPPTRHQPSSQPPSFGWPGPAAVPAAPTALNGSLARSTSNNTSAPISGPSYAHEIRMSNILALTPPPPAPLAPASSVLPHRNITSDMAPSAAVPNQNDDSSAPAAAAEPTIQEVAEKLLEFPESATPAWPTDAAREFNFPAAVGTPATAELSDEDPPLDKPNKTYQGALPIPPGVETRYWLKVYNRADSVVHDRYGKIISRKAQFAGITRQLAYEKMARDVATSLESTGTEGVKKGKEALQIASLNWTPKTQIVRRLASRGIRLHRKDWNSKLERQAWMPWTADEKHKKVQWMTNTSFEKQGKKNRRVRV